MRISHGEYMVSKKIVWLLGIAAVGSFALVAVITYLATSAGLQQSSEEGDRLPVSVELEEHQKVTDVRLPRHLVPKKYTLSLVPFIIPDNFTIKGYVEVEMEAVSKADNITLHVADMTIDNDAVIVMEEGGSSIGIKSHKYDNDREFYILMLEKDLKPGLKYTVKIHFVAHLKDNLKGFYRSQYKDQTTGKDEYLAVTQFQPTDARRAFPCFDEPHLKAKYVVSLGRKKDMSSMSNMMIKIQGGTMEGTDEYVWDHYMESVDMSTYLVAFVVSKFQYRQSEPRQNNVRFRIWSRPDALEQTEYARDIGPRILEFFENYFNVSFPLPKQDMIALPDFGAGAMENWGLITYRETALLYKEGVSAVSNKERIAIVVSHELAHQWFGNLVTPSWWTDLWLNEGFASYVQNLGVEDVHPDWKMAERAVRTLQGVLHLDALESSHPISIPVKHPDEINEIFDAISYRKGSSLIRMMDNFLTSQTLRRGLSNYLQDKKFQAAEQDDLWRHLTQQGHRDGTLNKDYQVKTIMDTWTLQMGFPVVNVERNYQDNSATLTQKRFFLSQKESVSEDEDYKWWIPITFTYPGGDFSNTYSNIWMKENQRNIQVSELPHQDTAVIFNVQETGYYRVNYDLKNWRLLALQLRTNHSSIHVTNRAQIIDDALNLAKSGHLDYKTALSLTGYLDKETEYIPWSSALSGLSYLNTILKRTPAYGEFKKYIRNLISPLYQRLGFGSKSSDSHLDLLLRKTVVSWACSVDHEDCKNSATAKFEEWMQMISPDQEGNNPVDVNLKFQTYCNGISEGGEKAWKFVWDRYNASNVATEKSTMLSSLGCVKDVWLLNRFLNMTVTPDSGIRRQDGSRVISNVAGNTVGRYLAFDFLRDNWDIIKDYFPGFSGIKGAIKSITRSFSTEFDLAQLKEFEMKHRKELGKARRGVQQAIETAEVNLDWMNRNYKDIFTWLVEQNKIVSQI